MPRYTADILIVACLPIEAEGGADRWARPLLPRIDPKNDAISAYGRVSVLYKVLHRLDSLPAN